MLGTVFDIKEFALNDGGGIRTTVFLKGCPLRCIWCHNPEGLSAEVELYDKRTGCEECGLCRRPCSHPECQPFGRCLHICPKNLLRTAGVRWDSAALAQKLLQRADIYAAFGGGVTLSGGEPLLQGEFVHALLCSLRGKIHRALETSGYATAEVFDRVTGECDFVYMDLKLADDGQHRKYTGVSNEKILANARALQKSGIPHCFRIPLIPGITDTPENLTALSAVAGESDVELLPYNVLAPAKYKSVNREFTDRIDQDRQVNADVSLFQNATVRGRNS